MHRLPSVDLLCGAKRAIRLRCVDIGGIREAPSERKRAIQAHFEHRCMAPLGERRQSTMAKTCPLFFRYFLAPSVVIALVNSSKKCTSISSLQAQHLTSSFARCRRLVRRARCSESAHGRGGGAGVKGRRSLWTAFSGASSKHSTTKRHLTARQFLPQNKYIMRARSSDSTQSSQSFACEPSDEIL